VPLAGPGAPTTPIARELVALPPAGIVRAIVTAAAAGTTVSPDAALSAGLRALAKLLAGEGDGAVRAVAQRLPIDIGRRLLADAGAVG
jgi:hypothetical protein